VSSEAIKGVIRGHQYLAAPEATLLADGGRWPDPPDARRVPEHRVALGPLIERVAVHLLPLDAPIRAELIGVHGACGWGRAAHDDALVAHGGDADVLGGDPALVHLWGREHNGAPW